MKALFPIALLVCCSLAHAEEMTIEASQAILGVKMQIKEFQKHVPLPVVFPKTLPLSSKIHNAYFHAPDKNQYEIILSEQKDCRGEKYCTLARMTAVKGAYPMIYYSMDHVELTERVQFTADIAGYYTPSFAIGSTTPAQLSFRCENVLYTLAWHLGSNAEAKSTLERLAKEIIESEPTCTYHR